MAHRVHWSALLVSSSVVIGASCATSEDDSGRPALSDGGRAPTGGSSGTGGKVGSGGGGSGAGGGPDGSAGTLGSGGSSGKAGSGGSSGTTGGSSGAGGSTGKGGTSGAGGSSGSTGSGGTGGVAGTAGTSGSGGAGGVFDGGPGCAGLVFCDDFEDGVADGWMKSGGTWSVLDDGGTRVYQGSNAEESWAGPNLNDQTVEARVKVTAFGGQSDAYRAGIMARHSGSSDFYTLQVRWDGSLSIRKSTSAVSGCGAVPSGVDPLQWFTLRLKVSGAAASVSLEGAVNGQVKLSCTHASGLASGQVGVITYGTNTAARFDDVRVTSP